LRPRAKPEAAPGLIEGYLKKTEAKMEKKAKIRPGSILGNSWGVLI